MCLSQGRPPRYSSDHFELSKYGSGAPTAHDPAPSAANHAIISASHQLIDAAEDSCQDRFNVDAVLLDDHSPLPLLLDLPPLLINNISDRNLGLPSTEPNICFATPFTPSPFPHILSNNLSADPSAAWRPCHTTSQESTSIRNMPCPHVVYHERFLSLLKAGHIPPHESYPNGIHVQKHSNAVFNQSVCPPVAPSSVSASFTICHPNGISEPRSWHGVGSAQHFGKASDMPCASASAPWGTNYIHQSNAASSLQQVPQRQYVGPNLDSLVGVQSNVKSSGLLSLDVHPSRRAAAVCAPSDTFPRYAESTHHIETASDSEAMEFSSAASGMSFQTSTQLQPEQAGLRELASIFGAVSSRPSASKKDSGSEASKMFEDMQMAAPFGRNEATSKRKTAAESCHEPHDKDAIFERSSKRTRKESRGVSLSVSADANAAHESADEERSHIDDNHRIIIKVRKKNLHLADDGYLWKKYGDKKINNHTHRRSYRRCAEAKRSKCRVVKYVQECSDDEDYVDFLYIGLHNHPPPYLPHGST